MNYIRNVMKRKSLPADTGIPVSASSLGGDRYINIFIGRIEKIVSDCMSLETLNVGFLADRMCMSHSTLYRHMTEAFGMGGNEFIRLRRLETAAGRLQNAVRGVDTVNDISIMCGFSSQAAFAKAFKKHFGISATEYIELHKAL